jgi:Predicted S-adenosylmethionine-dependent methyltransferase
MIFLVRYSSYSLNPWPKKKHNKRRIVNHENIELFAKKIKHGGILRLATDHSDYASWMLGKMTKHSEFVWQLDKVRDWYKEPADWTETKYQRKALAGDVYYFFDFKLKG